VTPARGVSLDIGPASALRLQRAAGNAAVARLVEGRDRRKLARSPADKVLKFGLKWLAKRSAKAVSKHIAKHGRAIAGRAIHSVFKAPKDIRWLIEHTLKEATEIAERSAVKEANQVIEEGGVRIVRQAGRDGKYRLLVQKTFRSAIGTQGETVLRVVLDMTGRIVTAFPADRLAIAGLTAAGTIALSEGTADAAERVHKYAETHAPSKPPEEGMDWEEWIPWLGDLWGGSLNAGEDQAMKYDQFIVGEVNRVIKQIEQAEARSIGPPELNNLRAMIRTAIAAPYLASEDADDDTESAADPTPLDAEGATVAA
jgi:hypothetical protein